MLRTALRLAPRLTLVAATAATHCQDDPYKTLGLDRNASQDDIRRAYKKRAAKAHPDHGGDAEEFKRVAAAYAVLSDDAKRKRYDAGGGAGGPGSGGGGGFPGGGLSSGASARNDAVACADEARPAADAVAAWKNARRGNVWGECALSAWLFIAVVGAASSRHAATSIGAQRMSRRRGIGA